MNGHGVLSRSHKDKLNLNTTLYFEEMNNESVVIIYTLVVPNGSERMTDASFPRI